MLICYLHSYSQHQDHGFENFLSKGVNGLVKKSHYITRLWMLYLALNMLLVLNF